MDGRKGAILITTLWILALLALLALGIGVRMGIDIKLIGFSLSSLKAHYIAEAGLRKTISLLEEDNNKNVDSSNEIWGCGFDFDEEEYVLKDIEVGEGSFTVSYEIGKDEEGNKVYLYGAGTEDGKVNINAADGELLEKLPGFSSGIVSAVLDWRDEDSLEGLDGAEDGYYEELDRPYECKDGKFSAAEELLLVKGITDEVYNGVKGLITVYGEDKSVNINTAPEEVLTVLIGEEFEDIPRIIVNFRKGQDGVLGTEDDRVFTDITTIVAKLSDPLAGGLNVQEQVYLNQLIQKKYFKVYSDVFQVISRGEVKNGRIKKTIKAVVKRSDKGAQILSYFED